MSRFLLPKSLKGLLHQAINRLGYQVVKKVRRDEVHLPLLAARRLLERSPHAPSPCVMFDVGANAGQTTETMLDLFPTSVIHAFEPGNQAFGQLSRRLDGKAGVHLHNKAVGSALGRISLNENSEITMSSILPLGRQGWGTVQQVREVEMTTVDEVCRQNGIKYLSILKSDTQGYDLEVLQGASGMLKEGRVDCVFFEVIFSELYQGIPRFDGVFSFLLDHGFVLVNIYNSHMKRGVAAWADALFINRRCLQGTNG